MSGTFSGPKYPVPCHRQEGHHERARLALHDRRRSQVASKERYVSRVVAVAVLTSFLAPCKAMILSHSRPAAYYYFPPLRLTTQIRSCTTTIPEVHEATLSLREVDYSGILQSARMVKVTRKTRVSFEKPADDIVMDELFGGDESDGFEEASDLFVSLMSLYSNSSSTSRLNGSNL